MKKTHPPSKLAATQGAPKPLRTKPAPTGEATKTSKNPAKAALNKHENAKPGRQTRPGEAEKRVSKLTRRSSPTRFPGAGERAKLPGLTDSPTPGAVGDTGPAAAKKQARELYIFSRTPVVQGGKIFPVTVTQVRLQQLLEKALTPLKEFKVDKIKAMTKETAVLAVKCAKESGASKRYRYVCIVKLGQCESQGCRISSRCLWSSATDTSVDASYRSPRGMFGVITLYAIYQE